MSDNSGWMAARLAYFRPGAGRLQAEFDRFCAYAKTNYLRHRLATIALDAASNPDDWNALLTDLGTGPFTDAAFHAGTSDEVRQLAHCGVLNRWQLPAAAGEFSQPYYQKPLVPDLVRFNVRFALHNPDEWHIDIKDNRTSDTEMDRLKFHASFVKSTANREYHITDTANGGTHFFYSSDGTSMRTDTPRPKHITPKTSPVQVETAVQPRATCLAVAAVPYVAVAPSSTRGLYASDAEITDHRAEVLSMNLGKELLTKFTSRMYSRFETSIFDQGMRFFDLIQKQTNGKFERVEFSVAAILGVVPAITDLELQVITELFGHMNPGGGGGAAAAAAAAAPSYSASNLEAAIMKNARIAAPGGALGGAGGPSAGAAAAAAASAPILSASNLTASMMENARIAALAPPGLSERNRAAFIRGKGTGYSYHPAVPNPNGGEAVWSKKPLTSSGVSRRASRRRATRKRSSSRKR